MSNWCWKMCQVPVRNPACSYWHPALVLGSVSIYFCSIYLKLVFLIDSGQINWTGICQIDAGKYSRCRSETWHILFGNRHWLWDLLMFIFCSNYQKLAILIVSGLLNWTGIRQIYAGKCARCRVQNPAFAIPGILCLRHALRHWAMSPAEIIGHLTTGSGVIPNIG